ncbi:hypothetical protein NQ317_017111 [Molorchus minor]|uniref:aspartate transaminase n=1 Tax=Molorchus minor TaxID=1323400 RepID=A0ABQ9J686_9CUCU|nr:hypothetical protein NQ317_017111 [Molorchus minor]
MSWFSEVELGPPIEVFALTKQYTEDAFEQKTYRTSEGKPWVLPVVRAAEKALANDDTLNKEYLPVLGIEAFSNAATRMLLGEDSPAIVQSRILRWKYINPRFRPRGFPRGSQKCPEGAVIILHACAHNPTGCDPTEDQWKQIAEVIREKKLFPFFDSAYQGFASGDLIRRCLCCKIFCAGRF